MKNIYLTGFMGAGKTTIGRKLGEVLKVEVIDTDGYIEEQVGEKISSIFLTKGEAVFRQFEREFLRKLPTSNYVITTGGGIILQQENREWMKKHGHVIYLHCDLDVIFNRLEHDTTRPLFDRHEKENTRKRFENRLPLYQEADFIIDTTEKSVDNVVDELVNWLNSVNGGNNN